MSSTVHTLRVKYIIPKISLVMTDVACYTAHHY